MAGTKRRNRELAAATLATGGSIREAATAAGCSDRTINNWCQEPEFQLRVKELRRESVGRAISRLADAMCESANVLHALLGSDNETERRHAATKILELGLKAIDIEELTSRIEELERRFMGRHEAST